jgi:hypothetical protein
MEGLVAEISSEEHFQYHGKASVMLGRKRSGCKTFHRKKRTDRIMNRSLTVIEVTLGKIGDIFGDNTAGMIGTHAALVSGNLPPLYILRRENLYPSKYCQR